VAGRVSGLVLVTAPNRLQQTGCPGFHDAQGQPIIEQYKKDNLTAYVEHDPVTGEALMLRTSTGMQSLYVYDGTGNPTALLVVSSISGPGRTVESGPTFGATKPAIWPFSNGNDSSQRRPKIGLR
jgi:hypothetical protein